MNEDAEKILLGAGIGFFSSIVLKSLFSSFSNELKSRRVLTTLRVEINNLWNRYYKTTGEDLEKVQKSDSFIGPLIAESNYFSTIEATASDLALIQNEDLANEISSLFIDFKGFLDSWRNYNKHYNDFFRNIEQSHLNNTTQQAYKYFQGRDHSLKEILQIFKTDVLFSEHSDLKERIKNLNRNIDHYLKKPKVVSVLTRFY